MGAQVGGNQHRPDRDPYDDYPTDPAWTRALLDAIAIPEPVWDPAAGEGQMVQAIRDYGYEVSGSDLARDGLDFLTSERTAASVITNPPYRLAAQFVEHAWLQADRMVAMLLPINSLGGISRTRNWWTRVPPSDIVICSSRMVVNGITSQFYHVWVVWQRQPDRTWESPVTRLQWAVPVSNTNRRTA